MIHSYEVPAAAIVFYLASIGMNIPKILTYHGSEPERIQGFARVGRFTAQQVITPSHRSAGDLIELGGLQKSKVCVIGLGVKRPPPMDESATPELRKKLLGEHGKILIVMVARIDY